MDQEPRNEVEVVSGIGCLRAKKRSNKIHNSAQAGGKLPPVAYTSIEEPVVVPAKSTSTTHLQQSAANPIPTSRRATSTSTTTTARSFSTPENLGRGHEAADILPTGPDHRKALSEDLRPGPTPPILPEPTPLLIEPELLFPNLTKTLLGPEEMEKYLPKRQIVVQITTWNMGSLPLPHENQLIKLFGHEADNDFLTTVDLHVIGIQECWPDVDTWELVLQSTLGNGYALFHSCSLGTLHLSVFIRRDLLWFTTEPTDITQSVRSGRLFKTKGCAGIAFGLFGSKLLFINAHLSAGHQETYVAQRVDELRKILAAADKIKDHHDAVFLFGDLNFRIFGLKYSKIMEALETNNIVPLLENDQLANVFRRKDTLPEFLEPFHEAAAITFRPTYKYDLGRDTFDSSSKQRAPAYTDRIIYKNKILPNGNPNVYCIAYDGVFNMRVSDHRPVYGIFCIELKPGHDTIHLSGARFKRELYIKAIQNQAKYLLERRRKLTSSICGIC